MPKPGVYVRPAELRCARVEQYTSAERLEDSRNNHDRPIVALPDLTAKTRAVRSGRAMTSGPRIDRDLWGAKASSTRTSDTSIGWIKPVLDFHRVAGLYMWRIGDVVRSSEPNRAGRTASSVGRVQLPG